MEATIKVQVAGSTKEYPANVSGYGDHLASGGRTVSLFEAQNQAKEFFRANQDNALKALTFWAILDSSDLAYQVEIGRSGHHRVMAAAPMTYWRDQYTA